VQRFHFVFQDSSRLPDLTQDFSIGIWGCLVSAGNALVLVVVLVLVLDFA
jgi:hypothetical protein